MTFGIRLRHLACTGPQKVTAVVEFGSGLNVIYGASDTGKSFVVNTIDFMLEDEISWLDIPSEYAWVHEATPDP